MKIVLMSDNHSRRDAVEKIACINNDGDFYWHLGDSQEMDSDLLRPFISVKGNCDYDNSLPKERIMELSGHRILLMHGHMYFDGSYESLAMRAKALDCDVLMFGHTHLFFDDTVMDVRMINPGSARSNRDNSEPSYALVHIDEKGEIKVTRRELTL